MTCKDCFNCDVCRTLFLRRIQKETINNIDICDHFKDKSKIVELPCNVGNTVYVIYVNKIYKCKVYGINIYRKSDWDWFAFLCNGTSSKINRIYYLSDIGKTVFLSPEEAENVLKERESE